MPAKNATVRCVFCAATVSVPLDSLVIDDTAGVYRTRCPRDHLVERELTIESRAILRDHQVRTIAEHMAVARTVLEDDAHIWASLGVGA
jgi:hypothetical protein